MEEDAESLEEKRARLRQLENREPPMLLEIDDSLLVPLMIPTTVERSDVVSALVAQVAEVRQMLDGGAAAQR